MSKCLISFIELKTVPKIMTHPSEIMFIPLSSYKYSIPLNLANYSPIIPIPLSNN